MCWQLNLDQPMSFRDLRAKDRSETRRTRHCGGDHTQIGTVREARSVPETADPVILIAGRSTNPYLFQSEKWPNKNPWGGLRG